MTDTYALSPAGTRAAVNSGAGIWNSSIKVAARMIRKFARTPQLIFFSTTQSALFLLMFRFAFGGAIKTHGSLSCVDFMVPGFIGGNAQAAQSMSLVMVPLGCTVAVTASGSRWCGRREYAW